MLAVNQIPERACPATPTSRLSFLLSFVFCVAAAAFWFPARATAQETPYFVAYSHHLEEPGNLEI